jgi:hypothetical protein
MPKDPLSVELVKPVPGANKVANVRRPGIFKRVRSQPITLARAERQEFRRYPAMPLWWPGTEPEWAIYWAHEPLGRGPEGVQWGYQVPLGGGYNLAGMVPDFLEFEERVAINVQGEYWHYRKGYSILSNDMMQRIIMRRFDYTLIVIDEADAVRDPIYFLSEAIAKVDHSLSGRLYGY